MNYIVKGQITFDNKVTDIEETLEADNDQAAFAAVQKRAQKLFEEHNQRYSRAANRAKKICLNAHRVITIAPVVVDDETMNFWKSIEKTHRRRGLSPEEAHSRGFQTTVRTSMYLP